MLLIYLILYSVYIFISNLCYKLIIYARFTYYTITGIIAIHDTIKAMAIINAYEVYIDNIYNDLISKQNMCVTFELTNSQKFISKIDSIYKINSDVMIFTSHVNFFPLYSNIKNITLNPNKQIKLNIYYIFKQKMPKELINYIGNYICDCKLCNNIIYSIKM